MYQDREFLLGLLFLALLMGPAAPATQCKSGIWYCDDPYNLEYDEVPCNKNTCKWKIWKMNPEARPTFCDDQNVTITSTSQQVPDWEEPCLLWEILYGTLENDISMNPTQPQIGSKGQPDSVHDANYTHIPTQTPTNGPTAVPTKKPTKRPRRKRTRRPTRSPLMPSQRPSKKPVPKKTLKPVKDTLAKEEIRPHLRSQQPSAKPSLKPSLKPVLQSPKPTISPTISYLQTGVFIEMQEVLITFSVSKPENLRRDRALQVFDLVATRARLLNLTKFHVLNFVSELKDAQLLMATYQAAQMTDGTWSDTEKITGQVSLRHGVNVTIDELDDIISAAFKGNNLIAFMMSLVDDSDPVLQRISAMSYGIRPGFAIFTSVQAPANPDTRNWSISMPVIILSGLALLFLCGVFLVLRFARRSKKTGPLTPATKATTDAEATPAKLDVPQTILSVDGVHAVAVSELAAESIVGVDSDLASLYSYRSYSLKSLEKSSLSGSYDPSYCLDGKDDVGKLSQPTLQVPNAEVSRSERAGDKSLSLKKAAKNTTPAKTVPANLYYAFDDNQSVSDKSNTSGLSSVTGLSNASGLSNSDGSKVRPRRSGKRSPVNAVTTTNSQPQTKATLAVARVSPMMDRHRQSTETQNEGTSVSESEEMLSQVLEATETSSRGESSSVRSGIPSLTDESINRPKSRKVEKQNSRGKEGLLTAKVDYDNIDDESEGTSLFSGPEGSYMLFPGDDTSQSHHRREAGPLANALDDFDDDEDDDKLIEIEFFGKNKDRENLEPNPNELVSEIPVVESHVASPSQDKLAFV